MASSNNPRWLLIGILVTFGLALAAFWPRGGANEVEEPAPEATEAREASPAEDGPPARDIDAGLASKRVAEDCEPVKESLKYEELVGRRALAILSWDGISERAANLKIPVSVVGIQDGAVGVRFMDFPMRAQYIGIWLGSGHIKAGDDDLFLLDPCSATLVEWAAMERGRAGDEGETGGY